MTPVVVSGARGRLGARIVEHLDRAPDLEVAAGLVRGDPAPDAPIPLLDDPEAAIERGRVLVEAALVPAARAHAARAAEVGVPVCLATTGFDARQRAELEALADRIPVLFAPNLSLGVNVLLDLVRTAASALPGYHLEVVEMHHALKRDAPSGTAWALASAGAEARGQAIERDAVLARAGETGPRGEAEIGIQTLRGGGVIGEHTVYLVGETERVELSHRAQSRDAFAAGAVEAARFLGAPGRAPGVYEMADVLGLSGARPRT